MHVNLLAAHAGRPLLTLDYEEKVGKFMAALEGGYLICGLDEMGVEPARKLMALQVVDQSGRLEELSSRARRC